MPIEFVAYKQEHVNMNADESEMKAKASEAFTEAAEEAAYGQVEDRTLFGKPAGFDLMESNAQAKVDIKNLQETVASLVEEVKSLTGKVKSLEVRSEHNIKFDERYRATRHRFLETYRRGQQIPRGRDAAAHHGDAIADSLLYTSGGNPRSDTGVMTMIYGFEPDMIHLLSKPLQHSISLDDKILISLIDEHEQSLTIGALNEHATLEVDTESAIPVPVSLKTAFRSFRSVVEDELEDAKLGKGHSAAWNTAYNNFTIQLNKRRE